jgi:hypothetical protein
MASDGTEGTKADLANFQLENYSGLAKIADDAPFLAKAWARKQTILELVHRLRAEGWSVVLFRLPLGSAMQALEQHMPAELNASGMAAEMGVPFLDYAVDPRTRDLPTQDESHLAPESVLRIAPILAQDILQILSPSALGHESSAARRRPRHLRAAVCHAPRSRAG